MSGRPNRASNVMARSFLNVTFPTPVFEIIGSDLRIAHLPCGSGMELRSLEVFCPHCDEEYPAPQGKGRTKIGHFLPLCITKPGREHPESKTWPDPLASPRLRPPESLTGGLTLYSTGQ